MLKKKNLNLICSSYDTTGSKKKNHENNGLSHPNDNIKYIR